MHVASQGIHVSVNPGPYCIQWTRYDPQSTLPEAVRRIPHVAFEVPDLHHAIGDRKVIVQRYSPAPGEEVVFVEDNWAPVKLVAFAHPEARTTDSRAIASSPHSMLRYNSCWIPTDRPVGGGREKPLKDLRMHVVDHDNGPYRVGWVRYEADAPYPGIVRRVPHLAFEVDSLDDAITGREVIISPRSPMPGLRLAFIEDSGAPVELLEIDRDVLPDGV